MKTTLNKIRDHSPCEAGWEKLLRSLRKTKSDDEPVSIIQVLDSNGLDDALWCLRAVDGYHREMRLYAVWCARQVEHLMTDPRSLDALNVAERHANGDATDKELVTARGAARGAAVAEAWAAAGAAARDAARAVAWGVARDAAWGVAWDAARDAAWDAARAAARAAQENELRRVCRAIEQGLDPYPVTSNEVSTEAEGK